jgi:chitodextrinase
VLSGIDAGATGGGCSPHFFAPFWQAGVANYAATGCGGARQSGDVAVVGDPYTGYDILDSSASTNPGWMTIGGTSLSSPLMAALWALAGGSHGVYYPGATLYANFTHHPSTLFDVTQGSNGVCDEAPASCASDWGSALGDVGPDNPNNTFYCADQACDNGTVWLDLDCAFAPDQNGANSTALVAHYNQCYAAPGYDGPSGVGVPDGLGAFAKPTATATISGPLDVNKRSAAFKAVIHDTVPGGTVSAAKWTFSDAAASKSGATVRHFSQRAGTFTAKVIVSDGVGVLASASRGFTIGYAPRVTVSLPSVIKENKAVTFTAKATDRNTSGRIRSYLWSFGHGITAHGARATHKWGIPGVHHVTLTVTDNQHNVTTKTITVRVRK